MLAVVKDIPQEKHIAVQDVSPPKVGPGWVLVRVDLAGICGSDLHTYHWTPDYQKRFAGLLPAVLGHEYTGIVEQVGGGVAEVKVGDRVVSRTPISCGRCYACLSGQEAICDQRQLLGVHYPGAMAEYVSVPALNCHVLPKNYPPKLAVLSEPISIAYGAVHKAKGLQGKNVAIIGPGPLGYLVALLAQLGGAARVLVLGLPRDAHRFDMFTETLVNVSVGQGFEEFKSLVKDETGGSGVDVVFEVSGAPSGLDMGLNLVRKRGLVVLVGIVAAMAKVDTNLAVRSEITIQGTPAAPQRLWSRMLDYLSQLPAQEQNLFQQVITHNFPLKQAREAFELMDAGKGMKLTLTP